jgi:hypothetical protein
VTTVRRLVVAAALLWPGSWAVALGSPPFTPAPPRRIVIHGTAPAPTPTAQVPAPLRFAWEDPNTLKVVDRSGDTVVVDSTVKARKLELATRVDPRVLAAAVAGFGVPESWLQITFSNESEHRAAAEAQRRRLASRGIELDENVARVDYRFVVDHGRDDVRELAERLREATERAGYSDARGALGMMAAFVQALDYEEQPLFRPGSTAERIYTGGVTVPLETLATRTGDCDTRAVLLAAVLANFRGTGVVFMEGDSHVFVGLRLPPQVGDRYVTVQGIDYVLVELTSSWPLGVIPEQQWQKVRGRLLRVIPIS